MDWLTSKSWTKRIGRWFAFYGWILLCTAVSPVLFYGAQEESPNVKTQAAQPAPAKPEDVALPPADAIRTASGIQMKVLEPGAGTEHPVGDDCVVLRFTAWKRDGSLFSTSGLHGESTVQCLLTAIPGISEALKLMSVGEKRRIWVPAKLGVATHIAHHGTKHVHSEDPEKPDLTVDLQLVRIMKAPVPPRNLRVPPSTALKTPSGVAIEILKRGTGTQHPGLNSTVLLNYTGWTADGKLFETTIMSGHPAAFLLGTALPGWRDALPRMVVGEKARVWVPAAMAYGEHPIDAQAPPGSMVYEIELLEFH